ncbi:MAG TPA: nickel/cobalt transporter [Xanthobacteraceae bacterium]|nr:nickel/cobalt transporter [Xanthobacteraceae bacterium]
MKTAAGRGTIAAAAFLLALGFLLTLFGVPDAAFAQGSPFGVGPRAAPPPPPAEGMMGWIFAKQAEFYRMLSGSLRAVKTDQTAVAGLFGISFLYGVFHAAGPGHGKAVISSYLFANNETWRRGVVLSFASAMLQALVAIVLVAVASLVLGATARRMGDAVWYIEIVAYSLIILIGLQLLWRKGRAFMAALRGKADHHGHHDHHHHDAACDHLHTPPPANLAGPGGWRRGLAAIVAVGLRPCSGAVLVLIFALAQGIFWAGIGATLLIGLGTAITVAVIATVAVGARGLAGRLVSSGDGKGALLLRGVEVLASLAVIAFGALLLAGYMANERMLI